jgi:hypothetical protein
MRISILTNILERLGCGWSVGAVPGTSCFNKRQTLKSYYEVPPALVTDKEKLLS